MSETCPQDAYHLDMPTACPLVYEALPSSGPSGVRFGDAHGTWGTSSVLRHGRFLYDEGRVQQAQEMMRSQVLRDIAVSTISSTCLLYTSPSPRDGLLSRMPSSA